MLHIFIRIICKFNSLHLFLPKTFIIMQYIGQNLREIRMKHKWTQEYVSKRMGISQTTLSRIENDPQYPVTDEEITKLAEVLETTIAELKKIPTHVSIHHNDIKGNGYVHHQTSNGTEQMQQALSQIHQSSQLMTEMLHELKVDKDFLKEENRQLRQRDEKWMLILTDMQKQLVDFLSKNKQ
jgi:transcriptional regulator with XRE-family HTH domain